MQMGEYFIGCSGWNYPDTPDKGDGLTYFTQIKTHKDFDTTLNSLILQRWILLSITDSTPK